MTTGDGNSDGGPRLRRTLTLWDLISYGIILIQPAAPMPVFGVVSQEARGHVVTAILIAMIAMLFTAISYGRMARVYPSAGSAFTYVGREFNPVLGYVTGWSTAMDSMLNPILCTIWCAKAAGNIVPELPYAIWAIGFALLFTGFNLRGIRADAHQSGSRRRHGAGDRGVFRRRGALSPLAMPVRSNVSTSTVVALFEGSIAPFCGVANITAGAAAVGSRMRTCSPPGLGPMVVAENRFA